MTPHPVVSRVVVAVLDGLRPDAIDRFGLEHWQRLARRGAETRQGSSVLPSVTAAALTSLFTGVAPATHGIESESFQLPKQPGRLPLVTKALAAHGIPSAVHIRRIPWLYRGLARQLARLAGAAHVTMTGDDAPEILDAATPGLLARTPGFTFLHFPDADRAGHAHGWMSAPYADAARTLDATLGQLVERLALETTDDTLLIACADHGGGGAVPTHHNSRHPLDTTIPVLLAGSGVRPGASLASASWLDIPATVAWALGVTPPAAWPGRPMVEAFGDALVAAA
ncbi:MAG: alkaline phosphatase family protein [Gemmatimonadaceae bacterium]|jgi:predicted AlkP superfamily pyrophosphatase or phosphodiesterase|nr:alkaline phosphatase family protein [Gemmatimonadaceae bacterium]